MSKAAKVTYFYTAYFMHKYDVVEGQAVRQSGRHKYHCVAGGMDVESRALRLDGQSYEKKQ